MCDRADVNPESGKAFLSTKTTDVGGQIRRGRFIVSAPRLLTQVRPNTSPFESVDDSFTDFRFLTQEEIDSCRLSEIK
jgi:hypothetical protein